MGIIMATKKSTASKAPAKKAAAPAKKAAAKTKAAPAKETPDPVPVTEAQNTVGAMLRRRRRAANKG